jgi:hypothetical protein
MWSILSDEDKKTFYEATKPHPQLLVTTSKFVEEFWPTASGPRSSLHAEQAWFGIRTVIKGMYSKVNPEDTELKDYTEKITPNHFSQLAGTESPIPRRWTDTTFDDNQLRDLIKLYNEYETWRKKGKKVKVFHGDGPQDFNMEIRPYYDELDIARVAIRALRRREQKKVDDIDDISDLEEWQVEERMGYLPFGQDRFIFKKRGYKKLDSYPDSSDQKEHTRRWLNQYKSKAPVKGVRCGRWINSEGETVFVYKKRLTKAWRIFFSVINDPVTKKEKIIIYDMAFDHDKQDTVLSQALLDELRLHQIPNDNQRQSTEDEEDIVGSNTTPTNTPGKGPLRGDWGYGEWIMGGEIDHGLWDILNLTANIHADQDQLRSIVADNPILINGMAGSGKTAMLAKRGAIRIAFSSVPRRLLFCCYNPHVLSRLKQDLGNTIDKEMSTVKEVQDHSKSDSDNHRMEVLLDPNEKKNKSNPEKWSHPLDRYHEILVDEAQDLTRLEFDVLRLLTVDNDVRRIQMAGDPLQTLNPSGFDWKQIQVMIREFTNKGNPKVMDLPINYRSSKDVVNMANAVQAKRNAALEEEYHTQEADSGYVQTPWIYHIKDTSDELIVKDKIISAPKTISTFIAWAMDDGEMETLFVKDRLLNQVLDMVSGGDAQPSDFRDHILIHSATTAKGLEFDVAVLYKFASNPTFRRDLASLILEDPTLEDDEHIRIRFAYSRLYVSLTRAINHLHIIEETEGCNFWKDIVFPTHPDSRDYFEVKPAHLMEQDADFADDIEASTTNFDRYIKNFRRTGIFSNIQYAILIAKALQDTRREHLACALRDEAKARQAQDTKSRKGYLKQAASHYNEAGEKEQAAKLYYEIDDKPSALSILEALNPTQPWLMLVMQHCNPTCAPATIYEIVEANLQTILNPPTVWSEVIQQNNLRNWIAQQVRHHIEANKLFSELSIMEKMLGLTTVIEILQKSQKHHDILKLLKTKSKDIQRAHGSAIVAAEVAIHNNKPRHRDQPIEKRLEALENSITRLEKIRLATVLLARLRTIVIEEMIHYTHKKPVRTSPIVSTLNRTPKDKPTTEPERFRYCLHRIGYHIYANENSTANLGELEVGMKDIALAWYHAKQQNWAQAIIEIGTDHLLNIDRNEHVWGQAGMPRSIANFIQTCGDSLSNTRHTSQTITILDNAYSMTVDQKFLQTKFKLFEKIYTAINAPDIKSTIRTCTQDDLLSYLKTDEKPQQKLVNWAFDMYLDQGLNITRGVVEDLLVNSNIKGLILKKTKAKVELELYRTKDEEKWTKFLDENESITSDDRVYATKMAELLDRNERKEEADNIRSRIPKDPVYELKRVSKRLGSQTCVDYRGKLEALIRDEMMPDIDHSEILTKYLKTKPPASISTLKTTELWSWMVKKSGEQPQEIVAEAFDISTKSNEHTYAILSSLAPCTILSGYALTAEPIVEEKWVILSNKLTEVAISQSQSALGYLESETVKNWRLQKCSAFQTIVTTTGELSGLEVRAAIHITNLNFLTTVDLRKEVKNRGITGYSKKSKPQLIQEIIENDISASDAEYINVLLDVFFWDTRHPQ